MSDVANVYRLTESMMRARAEETQDVLIRALFALPALRLETTDYTSHYTPRVDTRRAG